MAITERVARRIADRAEVLARHVHSAAQFLPNGRPPAAGECWSAPNLARSLRVVARDGAESFYRGELAKALLDFLALEGAMYEADDFARQEAATYERSRPTTAASPSTGRPRRLKDSCCWNSSTSWKASTCGRSIPSAPGALGPMAGRIARRDPGRRARRGYELFLHRGRRRQRHLLHPQPVRLIWLGSRGGRDRDHPEQPRRARLFVGRRPPQRHHAGQE